MKVKRKTNGSGNARIQDRLTVILVGPEYPINVGSVCRAMANFGFSNLIIVKPKCKIGFVARKYAKHALGVLDNARTVKTLDAALALGKFDNVIGTTGVSRRHKKTLRDPTPMREFAARAPGGKIALLFGREGIGLMQGEIDKCDQLTTIEASSEYPILNLSHAVAVSLYSLSMIEPVEFEQATRQEKDQIGIFFSELVDGCGKDMRNPHKVKMALKRVIARASPNKIEAASLLGVLRIASGRLRRGQ